MKHEMPAEINYHVHYCVNVYGSCCKDQCPGCLSEMCCLELYAFLLKWNRHRYDNFHFLKAWIWLQQFPFISRVICWNHMLCSLLSPTACLLTVSMLNNPYSSIFKILISPWMSLQPKRLTQGTRRVKWVHFWFDALTHSLTHCYLDCLHSLLGFPLA